MGDNGRVTQFLDKTYKNKLRCLVTIEYSIVLKYLKLFNEIGE